MGTRNQQRGKPAASVNRKGKAGTMSKGKAGVAHKGKQAGRINKRQPKKQHAQNRNRHPEPEDDNDDIVPDLVGLEDFSDENSIDGDSMKSKRKPRKRAAESDEEETENSDNDALAGKRVMINNEDAISFAVSDIALELPWIELHTTTSSAPVEVKDIHNDIERETAIYNQALEAAKDAKKRYTALGEPFTRPNDYFAEMMKSKAAENSVN